MVISICESIHFAIVVLYIVLQIAHVMLSCRISTNTFRKGNVRVFCLEKTLAGVVVDVVVVGLQLRGWTHSLNASRKSDGYDMQC